MHIYREGAPVGIAEMLAARDARARRQQQLRREGAVLIYLTMNIPGEIKVTPQIGEAFSSGVRTIERAFGAPMSVLCADTGLEAWLSCALPADKVKCETVRIEDECAIGRLLDIDVIADDGTKLSREALGLPPRRCLICGQPAFICARSRAHGLQALRDEINRRIVAWRADALPAFIGEVAANSLIREVETTPKPGLVDKRSCGSHPDMSLDMLIRSAHALQPYFVRCAHVGFESTGKDIFPELQRAGIEAEETMLRATGGVNTHRGAIFSLGLLCAAAAVCLRDFDATPESICRIAGETVAPYVEKSLHDLTPDTAQRFGEKLYLRTGIRGVRGEAADGFPTLLNVALPMLRQRGGAKALIYLLAETDDTTLIHRGGLKRAREIRETAKKMTADGISIDGLIELDELFIRENLTCGGCADLLACAYFLEEISAHCADSEVDPRNTEPHP